MDWSVEAVDPEDEAAFAAWHAVYARAEEHDRGAAATTWTAPEMRETLRDAGGSRRVSGFVGRLGGEPVAFGLLEVPLRDNLESAQVLVVVLPERRRAGLGSALLARLEDEAAALGRTVLGSEVLWPWRLGPEGGQSDGEQPGAGQPGGIAPGLAFAAARGYALELVEVQRRLRLPVPAGVLDDLAAHAATRHEGYALRAWVGEVPEELVGGWAVLEASLETEAPTGGLTREPQTAEVARVREGEALMRRQGRTPYRAVALDVDGTVVAYTEVVTTAHEPTRAYQWGTLVDRAHRGHRLGVALKVAAARLLGERAPGVESVATWNAAENEWMIAVNEALGFRPVEYLGGVEKRR
ncbi:GNAT family N-acetyltransferase [Nocardioides sp. GY 10127]|nr:GNAT family N-acetyltransferase [Nocardioides sp. GY 10127]